MCASFIVLTSHLLVLQAVVKRIVADLQRRDFKGEELHIMIELPT